MEEMYYYWLHNVEGIGTKTMEKILKRTTPKALYHCPDIKKTFAAKELSEKQKKSLEISRETWDLKKEWERLQKRGIELSIKGTAAYPDKLETISDPPLVLYRKGSREVFEKPSVAVVGARACSPYGSDMAKELGQEMARMGIVVVSGMAKGIDGICQWSALEKGGKSIGVLGCGVEICYPSENRRLYERLKESGCLVSENLPFQSPKAGLFPLRNRIISGLADIVVVVESGERSGTLITVDMALEQGKDVYAVPGRVTDPVSKGCNALIRQGAGMILSVQDFLEEICPRLKIKYEKQERLSIADLTKEEKQVLQVMNESFFSMEDIYQRMRKKDSSCSLEDVMETVLKLQLKKILQEENGYYVCNKLLVATGQKQC